MTVNLIQLWPSLHPVQMLSVGCQLFISKCAYCSSLAAVGELWELLTGEFFPVHSGSENVCLWGFLILKKKKRTGKKYFDVKNDRVKDVTVCEYEAYFNFALLSEFDKWTRKNKQTCKITVVCLVCAHK